MIKKYMKKLSQYPRLRIILIIVVVIIVVIGVFDLFSPSSHKTNNPAAGIGGSQINTQNLQQGVHSTKIGSQKYKETAEKLKEEAKNKKTASGQSYFSNVFSDADKKPTSTSSSKSSSTSTTSVKTPEQILGEQSGSKPKASTNTSESPSEFMKYHSPSTATGTNYGQPSMGVNGGLESAMRSSMDSYKGQWKLPTQEVVEGSEPAAGTGAAAAAAASYGGGAGSGIIIKAGTIMFAVLDNTLNSDYSQTTAMATIVAGKYRGAKLLGNFSRGGYNSEALTLNFSQMILPTQNQAIGISAIAIDPKTAQGALASNVNHHYLERFGSLFAAGFLQGFGNAYSNYQNPCYGTNNCFIEGNIQRPNVTVKTAAYQGLGQIGTNAASIVANNFNRPVTITLKQGTAMGIMFTNAVTNTPPKQSNTAYSGEINKTSSSVGSAVGTAIGSAVNSTVNTIGSNTQQGATNYSQQFGQNTGNQTQQNNNNMQRGGQGQPQQTYQPQF